MDPESLECCEKHLTPEPGRYPLHRRQLSSTIRNRADRQLSCVSDAQYRVGVRDGWLETCGIVLT